MQYSRDSNDIESTHTAAPVSSTPADRQILWLCTRPIQQCIEQAGRQARRASGAVM